MTNYSFDNAQSIDLEVQSPNYTVLDVAVDPECNFNAIIKKNDSDPYGIIYSIDPQKMLRFINNGKLNRLSQITLITRTARQGDGMAMWDVLFNKLSHEGLTACIMLADKDYLPTSMDRVITPSQFLNYSFPVSRIHLNQIEEGDKIGIGIFDVRSKLTYVLFYSIMNKCGVSKNVETKNYSGPVSLTGVNCQLENILKLNQDGKGSNINIGDHVFDRVKGKEFTNWIFSSVNDITEAYPWKPHLLPSYWEIGERADVMATIEEMKKVATPVRYEEFEAMCRKLYRLTSAEETSRVAELKKTETKAERINRLKSMPRLPVVWILSLDDIIIAAVPEKIDGNSIVVSFQKSSMGHSAVVERYLSGKDLLDPDQEKDLSLLLLESPEDSNNINFYRELTVNY